MFAIKFSMEKQIKFFWIAGFFLPAINATVFKSEHIFQRRSKMICFSKKVSNIELKTGLVSNSRKFNEDVKTSSCMW